MDGMAARPMSWDEGGDVFLISDLATWRAESDAQWPIDERLHSIRHQEFEEKVQRGPFPH